MDYTLLYEQIVGTALSGWVPDIQRLIKANVEESNHGHLPAWKGLLSSLPDFKCTRAELENAVRFEGKPDATVVREMLFRLHPWRKGPLHLGGIDIDTEWRSDWKWNRLKDHIAPLQDRVVLDIGCGNGYYLWRMLGAGARLALGIDPFLLFVFQFWATRHFAPRHLPAWVLPLGWEDLPEQLPCFDTVFSMGVLYHRRNPEQFLAQLQNYLRPGGELVLETLTIEGAEKAVLVPEGRYAKMRNVHYIPSVSTLESALSQTGWKNVRCINESPTCLDEQRSTDWMIFESLKNYLNPMDSTKTVEGHPAPRRAIVLANRPL